MSAPPPGGPSNGVPRPKPKHKTGGPLRPNRPKPSLFAPRKRPGAGAARPAPKPAPPKKSIEQRRKENGGWLDPPPEGYKDIPIMTTKKALLDGIRFHMMRLYQPKMDGKPIDPTNDDEFARPVTLHRRDPRQPAAAREVKAEEPERMPVDEQEAERLEQLKAEKEAQKAIDQAKIAPVAKDPNPKPKKKVKEEKTQFHRTHKSEAAKKESEIRYEEALPWHLEDADGKNVWVGTYVDSLSGNQVAFKIEGSVFRMIPLEKHYSFTSKPSFKALSIDEAEDLMGKKMDPGRWIMKSEEKKAMREEMEATRKMLGAGGRMIKTESNTFKAASRAEKMEHDDLDVSGDEFQDDDEAPTFERNNDEDEKDSKERIRREQLGANLFGDGDERQVEKEMNEELREELERQKYGKSTKKALIKRDREDVYESDNSQDNPWDSSDDNKSSDDEDEEDDDENKEGKDKDDSDPKDPKDPKDKDNSKDKDKSSGSKGSTPQGKKGKGIKRAGSPALSESSGNESTRKKKLKTATSGMGSRAGTPSLQQAAVKRKAHGGAGSGSDGEATGGEMSDGAGPKKKIKLKGNGARSTPGASRAGSPQGSPPPPGSPNGGVVGSQEILDKIPADGITLGQLIKYFGGRIGEKPGQMPKTEWIALVKSLCDYTPDKKLRKKGSAPPAASQ